MCMNSWTNIYTYLLKSMSVIYAKKYYQSSGGGREVRSNLFVRKCKSKLVNLKKSRLSELCVIERPSLNILYWDDEEFSPWLFVLQLRSLRC